MQASMTVGSQEQQVARNAGYAVACASCQTLFDAEQAPWCGCLATERTLTCDACGECFCRSALSYRQRFWRHATAAMWQRKFEEHQTREEGAAAREADGRVDVLVVDDEPAIRRAALAVMKFMGLKAIVATNGEEGLRLARLHQPRVVLTDALMPRLDGRELCRAIKDDPACASSRVIVMTALYTGAKHALEARRRFLADEFLAKPLSPAVLRTVLEQQLRPTVSAHA